MKPQAFSELDYAVTLAKLIGQVIYLPKRTRFGIDGKCVNLGKPQRQWPILKMTK